MFVSSKTFFRRGSETTRNELCVLESGNLSRIFYRGGDCDIFVRYGKKQTRGSRMRGGSISPYVLVPLLCCWSPSGYFYLPVGVTQSV